MLSNVLVVGGAGFLGHHLVQDILGSDDNKGTIISVLDINLPLNRVESVNYYKADISDRVEVQRVFNNVQPEVIFHMASPSPFETNQRLLEKVNMFGTRILIECALGVKTVKAFVYTSSSSVVHDHRNPIVNATEEMPVLYSPQQPEFYSHTKAVAEHFVLAANRRGSNMLTVSIRPASLYGEEGDLTVRNLVTNAQAGRARFQIGDRRNLLDNTYVANCTHAHILAANALLKASSSEPIARGDSVEGEAFFVTNDDPYEFWAMNRLVADIAGYPIKDTEVKIIPLWLMMLIAFMSECVYWIFTRGRKEPKLMRRVIRLLTMDRTFNIDKIKDRLAYQPRYNTEESLERAVKWYLKQDEDVGAVKKER